MHRREFIRHALCAAVGTSALTNTIRDLRLINSAMAQTPVTDYKAMVCIFLNGGNDANNLFIPTIQSEYDNYAAIRTPALAIPRDRTLSLVSDNPDGHEYGLHPACPELAALFAAGKMAPIYNVGSLVYPLTKAQYNSGSVPRPPQLFSHSDQQVQWQTSIPDQPQASTGWGGRTADLLDFVNPRNGNQAVLSMAISLAGANVFEVGGIVQQYSVSTGGVVSLLSNLGPSSAQAARAAALNSILGIDSLHANLLTQNYSQALEHAVATGSSLSTALNNSQLTTFFNAYPTSVVVPNGGGTINNSSLMAQLKMVARIIEAGYRSAPTGLGMKRQIFFCQVGGYDTHGGQTNNAGNTNPNPNTVIIGSHASLLAELSQSINAFQNAMTQIGTTYGDPAFDTRVCSFTASDFGRTFPSNSGGSDHGWGSHHLVVGGGVRGKRTYGKWPTLAVGGPDDTSTGRWIPTTSVDQFAATIAKWFGVTGSNLNLVFPNLNRFNAPDLGFMI
ncbi:MAG: DUF1501 domain-containing protein [Verrucomicrobia bacterium]|nr:DUF1501 domain-containing protein [Verrucomicrobiota bacterium]